MSHRLREQITQFEHHAGQILAGNLVAGLMLVFLLIPVLDADRALFWLSLHLCFNLVRYLLTRRYRKTLVQTETQAHARYHRYFTMVVISGLIWGLSAFLLYPRDSIEFQILYLLIMVGFTSTALSLINLLPRAYPLLLILIFASIFIVQINFAVGYSIRTSLVLVLYVLFMLATGHAFRRNLLESIDLRIKLQQQAIRDPLTGINNRRYFMEQLESEWKRCTRHRQPLTIMLIDIDHFKKVNDRYGHQTGDDCLKQIARLLDDNVRRTGDFVARIGGEEFAIVLPNSKISCARQLAEKLYKAIDGIAFQHQDETFHITVSMGIACTAPQIGAHCRRMFNAADEALYEAKAAGRNRYHIADMNCEKTD